VYTKKIKRGKKIYSYYYHNVKEGGRVKNIFLGKNKEDSIRKLNEIKEDKVHKSLLESASSSIKEKPSYLAYLTLLIIFSIGLSLFYFITQTTGFVSYDPGIVNLDVNNNISKNASLFVNVLSLESSKPITEFLSIGEDKIFVANLEIELNNFDLSLDSGNYTFVISLIDDNELLAITSKEVVVKNGVITSNETVEEVVVPEPVEEAIVSETISEVEVDAEIEQELLTKEKVRVIIKKKQEIEKINIDNLINLSKSNRTERVQFINDARFNRFKEQINEDKLRGEELAEFNEILRDNNINPSEFNNVRSNFENLIKNNAILDVEQSVDDLEAVEVTLEELNLLKQSNEITEIMLDKEVSLFVEESINLTEIDKVQEQGYSGNEKSVCILDTGINYNLFGLTPGISVFGYDFVNNDDDPLDDNGHGTSVSNILLKTAPNAKIYAVKVINNQGVGYESDVLAGLQYCMANNVDVISFSIGSGLSSGYCDSDLVANKSNSAVDSGIYVVAATGNDASSTEIRAPSCGSKVTRVSSSTKQDEIASFANTNNLIDLLAPGKDINTLSLNGNQVTLSGTSFSVPLVAGGATLILENRTLLPNDLTYLLRGTSEIINYNNIAYNRLNLWNALINNKTNEPYNYKGSQTQTRDFNFSLLLSSGPNNPGTTATSDCGALCNVDWTTASNVVSSNDAYATASVSCTIDKTFDLVTTNYGFALPTNTDSIDGIVVEVEKNDGSSNILVSASDYRVRIVKGGVIGSTDNSISGSWPLSDAYSAYGNSTYLWGETFTKDDINDANFGFSIAAALQEDDCGDALIASIDHIRITVYYTESSNPTLTSALITPTNENNYTNANLTIDWINPNDPQGNNSIYNITSNWFESNRSLLVVNLPFERNTSTQVIDYSGLKNHGTIYGDVLCSNANGFSGMGCSFDGNGDEIKIPPSQTHNFTTELTIEAWVYATALNDAIIVKDPGVATESIIFDTAGPGSNKLRFWLNNVSAVSPNINDAAVFPTNTWQYVAATMRVDSSKNLEMNLYRNGINVSTGTASGFVLRQQDTNLTIGCNHPCTTASFNGKIDNVRLWNRTLTPEQIYQNYINDINNKSLTTWMFTETNINDTYKAQLVVTDSDQESPYRNTTELLIRHSCIYSSGNWDILCEERCLIDRNINMNRNNITLHGNGLFQMRWGNLSNWDKFNIAGQDSDNICTFKRPIIVPGGGIE